MINLNQFVGYNLYNIRATSNLNLQDFARSFHTTVEKVCSYEEGEVEIPMSLLCQVAIKFNIKIENIFPCSKKNNYDMELMEKISKVS